MAGSFNRVFLMGNLTRDIELKHTSSDQSVATIGIAVNRRYTTKDGEKREDTTFVDCEAWGRTAEVMSQYLSKGSPVFIEGRLKLDQWDDRETGKKRSKLLVVIETFQFVDSKGSGGGGGDGGGQPAPAGAAVGQGSGPEHAPVDDAEIPF